LYVVWRGDTPPSALFEPWPPLDPESRDERPVRAIEVAFDGEDLAEFLATHALTHERFLERLEHLTLTARYIGFRAGFAYLDGWPEEWAMPRRATSRPVRRGAFAIAGSVAAFYPIDSPGGWNILGHTGEDLVDAIQPGERLRIVPVTQVVTSPLKSVAASRSQDVRFELVQSPLALSTDRPFDEGLAALACEAVRGNVALLECPMAGPRVRFHQDAVAAWCDTGVRVERVRAGEERTYGRVESGFRGYLAIGDAEGERVEIPPRPDRTVLRAIAGPHRVTLPSRIECEVTPQLNRIGIRLRPLQDLAVAIPADLRSIGMQCGTIQLHPDGSLVAMGPDHPVTGGYLQPMTVITEERWKLAQLRPGERVTLLCERAAWDQEPY
jgi:hypothetical protein